ncbi:hypothetical protein ACCO45_004728 [Purpureocillium lilacinum]|uniref:Uncharacterized protein n=1 Tax=Purpureocillium lilacinum TaxID=33203 RepID=A0ACC4DTD3_PURLI
MKRQASSAPAAPSRSKKPRPQVPDYHLTPSRRNGDGSAIWPAPEDQIERAREFILECVAAHQKTVIVPDKDADGLTSGAILRRTLILLGLEPELIEGHILEKGHTVHDEEERRTLAAREPAYIFVLDQGSRKSPPPVTACNSPPVATSSLLTYHICSGLHDDVEQQCDWLCVMGTHGDLGNTLKWEPPFPDMKPTFKKYTKKALNDAVSLINAPRRTASYNVPMAWEALLAAGSPSDLLKNRELLSARAEVNAEVERCTHTAPKFSADARIAVFRISSQAQVHPVIATRWAGHLQSSKLEVVLVANEGYLPGMVNFSCRIPRSARARDPPVNIIETLRSLADKAPDQTLRERLGASFARGHKEASGGIVPKEEFEELMAVLEMDRKTSQPSVAKTKGSDGGNKQSNTLDMYFKKG